MQLYIELLAEGNTEPLISVRLFSSQMKITQLPQSSLEIAESLEQLRWLQNGYKIKVGKTDVETVGIDTPQDLEKAEAFLKAQTSND